MVLKIHEIITHLTSTVFLTTDVFSVIFVNSIIVSLPESQKTPGPASKITL